MLEKYALVLVGFLANAPVAQPAPASGGLMVVEGGRSVGQTTPENARRDGLTVVDLSDDWLPHVFSETPGKPQPLRPYLIDLANGRFAPEQDLRARPRGPFLRGVRGVPEPEPACGDGWRIASATPATTG